MGGYISLHNASTAFTDAELALHLPGLQAQVDYQSEFWWAWGLHAYVDINGSGMPIVILDYPSSSDDEHYGDDADDAVGYHHVDAAFQPYAVVYAGRCHDRGKPVTAVISHELLEMLANQQTSALSLIPTGPDSGIIIAQEVCDPCEVSLYYEAPNGTLVSDFVYPCWYVPNYPLKVDYLGFIPGPLRLASGGYAAVQRATLSPPEWIGGDEVRDDVVAATAMVHDELAGAFGSRAHALTELQVRRGVRPVSDAAAATGIPTGARSSVPRRLRQPASQNPDIRVVKRGSLTPFGPGA